MTKRFRAGSAVLVSALLAFSLFSPVGCAAEESSDCCGCLGDHGSYACVDGECVDTRSSSSRGYGSSSSSSGYPSSSGSTSSSSGSTSSKKDAQASTPADGDATAHGCRSNLDCPLSQVCDRGVCGGCRMNLDCPLGQRCVANTCE